ncbi:MAG: hypothetical protein HOP16_04490 [Acidobacteria bacterium]|nr:hypothetical protein [Acidobacteriota bacterium]
MFARSLQKDQHERRFTIVQNGRYWEVLEELDRLVVRRTVYDDWHRVERAKRVFAQEVHSLCQAGWVES